MRSVRGSVEDLWKKRDGTPSAREGRGLRWRARYVNEQGDERSRAFARKVDAQRWLDEQTAARVTGKYVDPRHGRITLNSFYREWSTLQLWESTTKHAKDTALRSVTFGDVPFSELKPTHLKAWVKALDDRLEPSTVREYFVSVCGIINAAIAERMLSPDLTKNIPLPRVVDKRGTIPTPSEVGALLDAASPEFTAFVALCAFAGLRLGEALGLQVKDVDFLRREIRVERQVQGSEVRPPKYGKRRTVYPPEQLILALSEHLAREHGEGWVFSRRGVDDSPWPSRTVNGWWRQTKAEAGLSDSPYRIHDLRHFYASGLIADGCDVVTVQHALGHHSPKVTFDTYAHLWPNADERTRRAAERLFAGCWPVRSGYAGAQERAGRDSLRPTVEHPGQ